ncbi:MAG: decaprenylphospho-beta-D-erythro-pentofuranosid-2-ulose 2-reductase [Candidatus Dormibacteria bacterium]
MRDALGAPQSVLVLGGTSEIALAIVRHLLRTQRLQTIVLAARDATELSRRAQELREAGPAAVEELPFEADDTAGHPALIEAIFDRHGDIDLCLIAFGVLGDQARTEADAAAALTVMRTNLLGTVSVLVPLSVRLRRQGHGSLVALSSVAGERVRRANFTYGASKAGMDAYLQGMSDALHGSGVEVLVVRPGFVRTRMTAGMRAAPLAVGPDEVAAAVVAALGKGSATVWVPPRLRLIMWALRQLPRPLFRRISA